ncbi:DUF3566 domain-containing protein [Nocardioides sp. R-C-SC26]|uniref:DUF3566 domain-containing protein n=1 Tax=Nocardioides sp. R-C-SC26 TaxID=2870414 RepID=UPI001E318489|nr:DUF3566 domain-containing protein [Nocardioides sp. R-C-SC26]
MSDRPGSPSAPSRPTDQSGTAVRPGLAERLQAKLGAAADQARAAKAAPTASPARGPRRARLRLTRIDPWSVMKSAFLLSIAFAVVTVVAVAVVWEVLSAAGVWTSINDTVRDLLQDPSSSDFDIEDYLGTSRVLGFTMLVAAVDVVLITAMATLGAFLYNMSAALLGGIDVTLSEEN